MEYVEKKRSCVSKVEMMNNKVIGYKSEWPVNFEAEKRKFCQNNGENDERCRKEHVSINAEIRNNNKK